MSAKPTLNTTPAVTLDLVILPTHTDAATHSVCRLNPALRGARKWAPMFYIANAAGVPANTVAAELVRRQRLAEREVRKCQVKVIAL